MNQRQINEAVKNSITVEELIMILKDLDGSKTVCIAVDMGTSKGLLIKDAGNILIKNEVVVIQENESK